MSKFTVRLIGNILGLVAFEQNYSSKGVVQGGLILQGLGYPFFLLSTLAFMDRAHNPQALMMKAPTSKSLLGSLLLNPSPVKVLNLLTIVGTILLILGYTDDNTNLTASPVKLDIKAKAGDIIYIVTTVLICLLVCFWRRRNIEIEAATIYQYVSLVLVFMVIRVGYVSYLLLEKNTLQAPLWTKIILEYCPEILVVIIYFVLGLSIKHIFANKESNLELGESGETA